MLPKLWQFLIAVLDEAGLYRPSYETVKARHRAGRYLPGRYLLALSYIHDFDKPDFVSELRIIQEDRGSEPDGISNVELGRAESLIELWQAEFTKAASREIADWSGRRNVHAG